MSDREGFQGGFQIPEQAFHVVGKTHAMQIKMLEMTESGKLKNELCINFSSKHGAYIGNPKSVLGDPH